MPSITKVELERLRKAEADLKAMKAEQTYLVPFMAAFTETVMVTIAAQHPDRWPHNVLSAFEHTRRRFPTGAAMYLERNRSAPYA